MSRRGLALYGWLAAVPGCDLAAHALPAHAGHAEVESSPAPPAEPPSASPRLGSSPPALEGHDEPILAAGRAPALPDPQPGAPPEPPVEPVPSERAEPVATIVREVFFADRETPKVALTFDDGPSREHTPRILGVLARARVPATFFVLGDRAEKMPDLLAAIDDAGHEIGNHTFSHGSMRSMWASQIQEELTRTNDAVELAIGRRPALFRPPFGRYAPSALELIGEQGMNVVLWSVDAHDWETDAGAAADAVVQHTRAGDIVLLHDRTATTARALPAIVSGLRARGFELVTVSELTGLPPYAPASP